MYEIVIVVLLTGFYIILEFIRLLLWWCFSREEFMSWWYNTPVTCDEYTMYCPTYNWRGHIDRITINKKWLHRKLEEGTIGCRDKKEYLI